MQVVLSPTGTLIGIAFGLIIFVILIAEKFWLNWLIEVLLRKTEQMISLIGVVSSAIFISYLMITGIGLEDRTIAAIVTITLVAIALLVISRKKRIEDLFFAPDVVIHEGKK